MNKTIKLFIKPTYICNAACAYCYNEEHLFKFGTTQMSFNTFKKIINLFIKNYKKIVIIWHGGEPTCVDLKFYKAINIYTKKIKQEYNIEIHHLMLTNGKNFSVEWISFCKENNWEIIFSIDDPNFLFKGSINTKLETIIKKTMEKGIVVSTNTVLCKNNIDSCIDIYNSFLSIGLKRINFIPVIHHLDGLRFTNEFCNIYCYDFLKYMLTNNGVLENYLFTLIRGLFENVELEQTLQLSFDPNGDIYPSEYFLPQKYYCGNINNVSNISEILNSIGYIMWQDDLNHRLKKSCNCCSIRKMCLIDNYITSIVKYNSIAITDNVMCEQMKYIYIKIFECLSFFKDFQMIKNEQFKSYLLHNNFFLPYEIETFLNIADLDIEKKIKIFLQINRDSLKEKNKENFLLISKIKENNQKYRIDYLKYLISLRSF